MSILNIVDGISIGFRFGEIQIEIKMLLSFSHHIKEAGGVITNIILIYP